jgi:hypothetical protein
MLRGGRVRMVVGRGRVVGEWVGQPGREQCSVQWCLCGVCVV